MEFHQALSARLPAPRDDEPQGLRQDIVDELADHLASSANREMLRGADAATARARVLDRFGDPAAVARRLWLDEMKGRIMAQRVVIVTCVLVTAASLALAGVVWSRSLQARDAVARLMAEERARAEAREEDMLKQLRDMSDAIRHPRSLDWNPVRFKLTEDTIDGPPVAEVSIVLFRANMNPSNTIHKVSDASGLADFGLVQPGDYTFRITKQWADGYATSTGNLKVQPGSDVTKLVISPRTPPVRSGVSIRSKWPADLEKETLCLYAPFTFRRRKLGPDNSWVFSRKPDSESQPNFRDQNPAMDVAQARALRHAVLCGPSGGISEFLAFNPFVWTFHPDDLGWQREAESKLGSWADVVEKDIRDLPPGATIDTEIGRYVLSQLLVFRPAHVGPGQRRYDLLVATSAVNKALRQGRRPGDGAYLQQMRQRGLEPQPLNVTLELPQEYWLGLNEAFEAKLGQPNEWAIPIPDELAQAVRKALKAEKAPAAQPVEKSDASKGNG